MGGKGFRSAGHASKSRRVFPWRAGVELRKQISQAGETWKCGSSADVNEHSAWRDRRPLMIIMFYII